ncbi:acyltransferase family protein [Aquabacter sp. CN5-332]|uniref:acyltransferase family protein n=1 Tax=Aquabacter sp. CN5-332 TaxID=3156608 RepID=UPI0032B41866
MKLLGYFKEIDGLRAFAVMAVITFHFQKSILPFGYLGVDVFFVISGFVISQSIWKRMDEGRFAIDDFFMRRFKRLFPALALLVISTIFFSALVLPKQTIVLTGAAALAGVSNIALWGLGHDYFAAPSEWNPLTHTWSLGVEEQFYLVFPFLLALLSGRPLVRLVLALIAATSLAAYLAAGTSFPTAAFYLPIFRFWEFLSGALIFFVPRPQREDKWSPRLWHCLQYALLAALLILMGTNGLPEALATVLCAALACGLVFASSRQAQLNPLLCHPLMQGIGRISYALYLWHWPVVVFTKLLAPPGLLLPLYASATLATATLSYVLVERPLRRMTWPCRRERIVLALPAAAAASAVLIAGLWLARPMLYLGPPAMLERYFLVETPCHAPGRDGLQTCLRDAGSGQGTVWLLGDSHAGSFLLALRAAGKSMGMGVQHLTGRSLYLSLTNRCSAGFCQEGTAKDLTARMAAVSKPGDVVFLSFVRTRLDPNLRATFQASLETLTSDLSGMGLHVILIEDIPKVCGEGEFLRSTFDPTACRTPLSQSRQGRQLLSDIYSDIKRRQDVEILDPHDMLCETGASAEATCGSWLNGQLLYMDSSPHLTAERSAAFTDFFLDALRRVRTSGQLAR